MFTLCRVPHSRLTAVDLSVLDQFWSNAIIDAAGLNPVTYVTESILKLLCRGTSDFLSICSRLYCTSKQCEEGLFEVCQYEIVDNRVMCNYEYIISTRTVRRVAF